MRIKHHATVLALVVILASCICLPGYAQETPWEFHLVPYLWTSGLTGEVLVKGLDSEVDATFSEIWDALDFAFMLHGELRKGRWGGWLDPSYLKLSKDAKAGSTNVLVELEDWIVDFGGYYRFYEKPMSSLDDRVFGIEALVGGRYFSVATELDVTGIGDVSGSKGWVDPIIGARFLVDFTEKLAFTVRGDVGGFGISSDLTWNVATYLGYQFTPLFSVWGGFRAMGVDYTTGSGRDEFKYDMTMSGPVVGLGFSF